MIDEKILSLLSKEDVNWVQFATRNADNLTEEDFYKLIKYDWVCVDIAIDKKINVLSDDFFIDHKDLIKSAQARRKIINNKDIISEKLNEELGLRKCFYYLWYMYRIVTEEEFIKVIEDNIKYAEELPWYLAKSVSILSKETIDKYNIVEKQIALIKENPGLKLEYYYLLPETKDFLNLVHL